MAEHTLGPIAPQSPHLSPNFLPFLWCAPRNSNTETLGCCSWVRAFCWYTTSAVHKNSAVHSFYQFSTSRPLFRISHTARQVKVTNSKTIPYNE